MSGEFCKKRILQCLELADDRTLDLIYRFVRELIWGGENT